MPVNKKAARLCLFWGVVLILSALLLLADNEQQNQAAGRRSDTVLARTRVQIEDASAAASQPEGAREDAGVQVTRNAYETLGILDLPDLGLSLPVLAQHDKTRLKIAPCRYCGSLEQGNLVIAAHNYKRHFGNLKKLEPGAEITFTDLQGMVHPYVLDHTAVVEGTNGNAVVDSGFPLVLYTCDYIRTRRIVLFFSHPAA